MSDCMTQEDAERMDASQAAQILKPLRGMMLDQNGCPISDAYFALGKAIEALKQQTLNAAPVVRCKDCIHAKEMTQYGCGECVRHCEKLKIVTSPEWFCAEGRRKDEGGPD